MNASNEDEIVPTTEELLARTSSWTLACDNLLLNKLKKFSNDLEQSSLALNEDCENLSRDANVLQAKLHNVTNQFLALSSSQFVENRVQDFEEAAAAVSSSRPNLESNSIKKTKAEKEAELIAKMKKSIQIGISVNAEHLQFMNQQSEGPKLETFPHLIGSSKFFSSRYVGLVQDERRRIPSKNLPANYQNSDVPPVADSSNHSGLPSLETSAPKDFHIPVAKSLHPPEASLTPSPTSEDVFKNISPNSNSIHKPLWNQSVITPPTYSKEPPSNARQINPTSVHIQKQENYFNDDGPPPVLDSEDSDDGDFKPIAGGGDRLFEDDDDEDIFNDSSLFPPKRVQNSFFNTQNTIENIAPAFIRASPPPLEDVVAHNDEIFTNTNPKSQHQTKVGPPPVQDKITDTAKYVYRSDDKSQKDGTKAKDVEVSGSIKSKIPPGGVSIFGSVPPTEFPNLRKQLNSKEAKEKSVVVAEYEPETQLPKGNSNSANACVNVSDLDSSVGVNEDQDTTSHSSLTSRGLNISQGSLNEHCVPVSRQQPKGIFNDDDSDDDLFSSKKPPSTSSTHPSSAFNGSLPTDDQPPTASFTRNKQSSKSKIKSSIFDDSDSDDDLFSSSSSTSSKITQQKTRKTLAFPIHEEIKNHPTAKVSVPKNRGGSSLFDNDTEESDSDLFSSKGRNLSKSKTKRIIPIPTDTGVIGTSQTRPTNLIKDPEVHGTTHLKASAKGSSSQSVIAGRDSSSPGIKMQAELTEEKEETENSSSDKNVDNSTHSFNKEPTTESESSTMSPPALEKSDEICNPADNIAEFSNPPALEPHSLETPSNPAGDMKPPVVSPSESAVETSDVPDNSSAVSVKKIMAAVPGSKISQLKDRLSASDLKTQSPIENTNEDKNSITDKLKQENKIGKLKNKLSSDNLFKQKSPTDLSTTSDTGKAEKTGSKISKLKEKLSTSESPSKEAAGSDKLSGLIGKSKVDVKKLALGLKINPLAMMPGAKLEKQTSLESPCSETNAAEITPDSPSSIPAPDLDLTINPLDTVKTSKPFKQRSVESPQSSSEGLPEITAQTSDSRRSDPLSSPDKVDVKKLALDLKINPLAMMPGAKPVKQKSLESPTTPKTDDLGTPDSPTVYSATSPAGEDVQVQNTDSLSKNEPSKLTPETTVSSKEGSPESSILKPLLPNLSKGRAKIQFKRRPPSKKLLHACNTKVDADNPSTIDTGTAVAEVEDENGESERTVVTDSLEIDKASTQMDEIESLIPINSLLTDAVEAKNQNVETVPDVQSKETLSETNVEKQPEVEEAEITGVPEVKKLIFDSEDIKPTGKSLLKTPIWDDSDSDDIFVSASVSSKRPKSKHQKPEANLDTYRTLAVTEKELPQNKIEEQIVNPESNYKEEIKEPIPPKAPESDLQHHLPAESKQRKNLFSDDEQKSDDEDIFKSRTVPKRIDSGGNTQPVENVTPPLIPKPEVKTTDILSQKQKKSKNPALFNSDSDSDDLFKSSKHSKTKLTTKKDATTTSTDANKSGQISGSSTSKPKSVTSKKVIFDDSSDEDLFAPKSKKKTVP